MKKKMLAMSLIMTLAASSFIGCAKKQTVSVQEGTSNTGKLFDKPIEITYFLPDENNNVPITDDMYVFKEIFEKTNVKIKVIPVPLASYTEKLGTTLASGNLPDLMAIRGNKTVHQYGPQGAFVNLQEYIDKGKMPNFKKLMDNIENSYKMAKSGDGGIYGAPRIYDFTWVTETFMTRYDILKKNNIAVPKNFDELYAACKKLKEIYPNSAPLTNRWEVAHLLTGISRFHHSESDMYFNHDSGKWNFGPLEEGFKESLEFLAKMYKEGLLDKEFATQADSEWTEKLIGEKAFFTYDYINSAQEIKAQGLSANPNFDYSGMLPLEYKGKVTGAETLSSCYTGFNKVISSKSKYKDEIVKFLDWTYSPEGIDITNLGKDGETFTRENSKVKYTRMIKTPDNPNGQKTRFDLGLENQNIFSVKSKDTLGLKDESSAKADKLILDAKAYGKPQPTVNFSDDDREKVNNILTPIRTYTEEAAIKVITGSMSVSEWDKVISKLKDMKIEEAVKIYQTTYDNMYKK
ncbi:extracellular solute-binding protein [Clostridium swellfunianum]|uniref:extracellular solute-binding protein n=1 Tax=Clostridium swellfunianum TaxID=1367462 RepID=UPI00202E4032|nr:extracellular solute-binding protein [Clostridium swellfunianum]